MLIFTTREKHLDLDMHTNTHFQVAVRVNPTNLVGILHAGDVVGTGWRAFYLALVIR